MIFRQFTYFHEYKQAMYAMAKITLMTATMNNLINTYFMFSLHGVFKQKLSFIIFFYQVKSSKFASTYQHFVVKIN